MKKYDIILIGTGQATGTILPGLLDVGKRIAVIERDRVGGSCVNWGCTPTKTLVASARVARMVQRAGEFGIETGPGVTDFSRVMERVNSIRNEASTGFQKWLEEVTDFYPFSGSFVDEHTVKAGDELIQAETIIIHTGAASRIPQLPGIESVPWLDNKRILDLTELPDHLLVIGGSYIGLEFGQAFRRFGSRVTVFEHGERLVFREDPDISTLAKKLLADEGVEFHLKSEILSLSSGDGSIVLHYKQGESEKTVEGSHLLVAAGRAPAVTGLNLGAAGVETDDKGYIRVDDYGCTGQKHIYALGDVNGRGAFTHTSVNDGQVFLDHYLRGGGRKISDRVPVYAMYIDPPLARVGLNRRAAEHRGLEYLTAEMPMSSVSRAKEKSETDGIMQVLTEAGSSKILGATLFGTGADEVIALLALAMQAGIPYTKLQETVIPHPTVAELVPFLFKSLAEPE
ncbi:mercuric reductase [Marispirochaeta aestuarii]|uniref:mercuric reductase n=1 Tax=Marispirochaeta aestuarii TaxID=1963862 RepID=UPI002ABE2C6E|nr:mercuric reductase [Marispirochaeta aestuarii]